MRPTSISAKARGIALIGLMAAISAGLWLWPVSSGTMVIAIRAPEMIPSHQASPAQVAALAPAESSVVPPAAPRRIERQAAAPRESPVQTVVLPAGERIVPPHVDAAAERQESSLLASRRVETLTSVPAIPVLEARPLDTPATGNPAARAGVAVGKAFKRAGLSTASAFTRIF
jgi:hypothetical protein